MTEYKLTQFSHGAGCGCKISPAVLSSILGEASSHTAIFNNLLVGNAEKDDAAVYDLGDGTAIISTTDFFMPIVDDPFTFGSIASVNAISDIYAMGGKPLLAIAVLGWPVDKLPPDVAGKVIEGARAACQRAGIPLAGGHSIDSPEPIFGLAVTGRVDIPRLKKNGGALPGDKLYLTKPLGIGIYSTAQKKGHLTPEDHEKACAIMLQLNDIGEKISSVEGVHAMTDVTGFGLAGHLIEMCEASNARATIDVQNLPLIDKDRLQQFIGLGCIPGGTQRNFASYGHQVEVLQDLEKIILCDPQTSGGLLIAVSPDSENTVVQMLKVAGLYHRAIGQIEPANGSCLIHLAR
jgi:selenide,water dikinase